MRRSLWLSIVLLVAVIAVSTLVSCKDEPEKAVPLTEDTTVWENWMRQARIPIPANASKTWVR